MGTNEIEHDPDFIPPTDYRIRTPVEVRNPRWMNADQTMLDVEVLFEELRPMGFVAFTTNPDADTDHGVEIWDKAIAGEYGPIAEFVPPTPEHVRANMPNLERWRVNTVIDLEPGLREKIDAAIDAMPEPQRTISKNKLADVQMFSRTDPLFDLIGSDPSIGKTPEDIDAMWELALSLE